eukprot:scaffold6349_cov115-Isochrysis_galbana.AAC.2
MLGSADRGTRRPAGASWKGEDHAASGLRGPRLPRAAAPAWAPLPVPPAAAAGAAGDKFREC